MFVQLVISTAMVLLCVAIHGAGLFTLSRVLRLEAREEQEAHLSPIALRGAVITFAVVVGLFTLHAVEIWLYAALYLVTGTMPDLETAVYFSTITYATIGYEDYGLATQYRLVAAIEGIAGVILLGWTTAFFISVMGRLRKH